MVPRTFYIKNALKWITGILAVTAITIGAFVIPESKPAFVENVGKGIEVAKDSGKILDTRTFSKPLVECTEESDISKSKCTKIKDVEYIEYATYKDTVSVQEENEIARTENKITKLRGDGKHVDTFFGKAKWTKVNEEWHDVEYKEVEKTVFDTTMALLPTSVYAQSPETFTTSGTFTVPAGVTSVEVLVVAGGGGGGAGYGGAGGGGGQVNYHATYSVTPSASLTVTIGNGGTGVTGNVYGNAGQDSSFDGQAAKGGGAGAGGAAAGTNGGTGGSGGGASGSASASKTGGAASALCPTGFTCRGYAGGNDSSTGAYMAAGGGGAGEVGGAGGASPGTGGDGYAYSISGASTYYGGGGGGSGGATPTAGGLGGGGQGSDTTDTSDNGTANTGGGGGGDYSGGTSGSGGTGIVIVAYTAGAPSSSYTTGISGIDFY